MQDHINSCEKTIIEKFSYTPKMLSNCEFIELPEFILLKSLYNTSMFNIAWLKSSEKINYKEKLKRIIDKFYPNPFALWIGPNSLSRISEIQLNEIGFIKEANEIGMHLELRKNQEDIYELDLVNIFEVKNKEGMMQFISVLEAYDPFVREYYLKVLQELGIGEHRPYRYFWLSVNGKAACIASLFFNDNYCGIFDVVTHENYRKQGNANRLMKYLLAYSKKQGATFMCLTASSPEAVSLYKKIGFINLGNYECYEFNHHKI